MGIKSIELSRIWYILKYLYFLANRTTHTNLGTQIIWNFKLNSRFVNVILQLYCDFSGRPSCIWVALAWNNTFPIHLVVMHRYWWAIANHTFKIIYHDLLYRYVKYVLSKFDYAHGITLLKQVISWFIWVDE